MYAIYLTDEEAQQYEEANGALARAVSRLNAATPGSLDDDIAIANLEGEAASAAGLFQDLVARIEEA